jgi:hypothetical protein
MAAPHHVNVDQACSFEVRTSDVATLHFERSYRRKPLLDLQLDQLGFQPRSMTHDSLLRWPFVAGLNFGILAEQ